MPDLSIGLTVAIVGMLGTLLALGVVAGLTTLLHRAFPEPLPGPAGASTPAGSTRNSEPGTRG